MAKDGTDSEEFPFERRVDIGVAVLAFDRLLSEVPVARLGVGGGQPPPYPGPGVDRDVIERCAALIERAADRQNEREQARARERTEAEGQGSDGDAA